PQLSAKPSPLFSPRSIYRSLARSPGASARKAPPPPLSTKITRPAWLSRLFNSLSSTCRSGQNPTTSAATAGLDCLTIQQGPAWLSRLLISWSSTCRSGQTPTTSAATAGLDCLTIQKGPAGLEADAPGAAERCVGGFTVEVVFVIVDGPNVTITGFIEVRCRA